jgi:hypothetical protein
MAATLNFKNRLSTWLRDNECAISSFLIATGINISVTQLTSGLNGVRRIDAGEEIRLQAGLTELQTFIAAVHPIPINFRRAELLRDLLDAYRKGHFRVAVIDERQ